MGPWTSSCAVAALLAGMLPAAAIAQSEPGGEVMFVSGVAERIGHDGRRQPVAKGMQLMEGDRVKTNGVSHVYVRMRDGGLLVVRPSSELHVDVWHFDPARPQDSRIKYTLDNGVARHVSGEGAKAARDKFRFNTPMAAIGVRGTDFTVLAAPQVTRVAVASGGVIVNALGNGCRIEGLGPCEGASAVELFATAKDKLLQLRLGERRPELIDAGSVPAPDAGRPAASGEPTAQRKDSVEIDLAQARGGDIAGLAVQATKDREPTPPAPPPPPVVVAPPAPPPVVVVPPPEPPIAVWGRWAAIADKDPGVVDAQQLLNGRFVVAANTYYILAANARSFNLPNAGVGSFALTGHDGIITDQLTGQSLASTASDGSLRIDFGTRRFETKMNVKAGDLATDITAKGSVENDGKFLSDPFAWPSSVQGVVGGKDASQAMYLYQRVFNSHYQASGATSWSK